MSVNVPARASTGVSPSGARSMGSPASPSSGRLSGSWRVRRSSFLSESMMREEHNSFEVGLAEDGSTRYSVSVKESQGFQWNQELFISRMRYRDDTDDLASSASRPVVQDIVVDDHEDIFPSEY